MRRREQKVFRLSYDERQAAKRLDADVMRSVLNGEEARYHQQTNADLRVMLLALRRAERIGRKAREGGR